MSNGKRVTAAAVAAAAGLIALIAPAIAAAAPDIRYVKKTFEVTSQDDRFVTAQCKGGKSVIGGGFDGGPGDIRLSYLMSSRPVDLGDRLRKPDDGWRVGVRSFSGQTIQGTVFAACAKTRASYGSARAFGGSIGPGEIGGAAVACPRAVLGGGISIPPNAIGAVSENYNAQLTQDTFGWSASVDAFAGSFRPKIWVVCGARGTRVVNPFAIVDDVTQPLREKLQSVSCPAGSRLSSVGAIGYSIDHGENRFSELMVTGNGAGMRGGYTSTQTGNNAAVEATCVKRLPVRR